MRLRVLNSSNCADKLGNSMHIARNSLSPITALCTLKVFKKKIASFFLEHRRSVLLRCLLLSDIMRPVGSSKQLAIANIGLMLVLTSFRKEGHPPPPLKTTTKNKQTTNTPLLKKEDTKGTESTYP